MLCSSFFPPSRSGCGGHDWSRSITSRSRRSGTLPAAGARIKQPDSQAGALSAASSGRTGAPGRRPTQGPGVDPAAQPSLLVRIRPRTRLLTGNVVEGMRPEASPARSVTVTLLTVAYGQTAKHPSRVLTYRQDP